MDSIQKSIETSIQSIKVGPIGLSTHVCSQSHTGITSNTGFFGNENSNHNDEDTNKNHHSGPIGHIE